MDALFYAAQEYLREMLHSKVARVDKLPWNIPTLLRDSVAFESLKAAHTLACERRQVQSSIFQTAKQIKIACSKQIKQSQIGDGAEPGTIRPVKRISVLRE